MERRDWGTTVVVLCTELNFYLITLCEMAQNLVAKAAKSKVCYQQVSQGRGTPEVQVVTGFIILCFSKWCSLSTLHYEDVTQKLCNFPLKTRSIPQLLKSFRRFYNGGTTASKTQVRQKKLSIQ